jgi:hypothetical protein
LLAYLKREDLANALGAGDGKRRAGGREGGREGRREGGRKGGREEEREGGRKGGREEDTRTHQKGDLYLHTQATHRKWAISLSTR